MQPTLRRSVKRHYTVGESEELQPAIQISLTDISLTAKQGAGAFRCMFDFAKFPLALDPTLSFKCPIY